MNKLLPFLLFVSLTLNLTSFAQEPQYSQFYVVPFYLNPAFAGNTSGIRVSGVYRNQWPGIPGTYNSFSTEIDANLEDISSGIAAYFNRDVAGSGGLSYTNFGAAYSYTIRFNRHLALRPAMGIGFSQRGVDPSKLVFGDQLLTGSSTGVQAGFVSERVNYMDVNAGAVLFGDLFFVGYGAFHLNRPNESLMENEELTSIRHSLHGGYMYVLQESKKNGIEMSLNFTAHYKAQRNWDQFDVGGYFLYDPLMAGIWYRGIPGFKRYNNNQNNDAVVVMLGVKLAEFRVAYSYDITVSQLWGNTGGAHEISLVYEKPRDKKRRRRFRKVPCPSF